MYPNVKAEMARHGITLEMLAKPLDITPSTLSRKLNGHFPLTLKEATIIKKELATEQLLEILFKEAS